MDESQDTTGPANDYGYLERPRGGKGRFDRSPDTALRDAEACELRKQGYTYDMIAKEMHYADRGAAFKAVDRALKAHTAEAAESLRKLMTDQLLEAYRVTRTILRAEHLAHSGGKIVYVDDPDSDMPVPVRDSGPNLAAADRIVRITERLAKLYGADAPTKVQMLNLDQVQAEIDRLEAEERAAFGEHDHPDEHDEP